MLLQVMLPHHYKMVYGGVNGHSRQALVMGPIPANGERDKSVSQLVERGLIYEAGVLVLKEYRPEVERINPLAAFIRSQAFQGDPAFSFMSDRRITSVCITDDGLPLDDAPPEGVSKQRWNFYKSKYLCRAKQRVLVGDDDRTIFIGGLLEDALSKAMLDFKVNFPNTKVAYVPDLCVSRGESIKIKAVDTLSHYGVEALTLEEALIYIETSA
ncbi:hypothetical protein COV20_02780 [Candidatus Woesearchaeota archaeon CG10_big_fil_rev_8_21_14_0_10_45_16]|nr:MAG: hypothetical protein COV20_02780 [Candidatus Woesearchaeota archaeon CG10_big_fil_rev_8_21_14_0_10_45_16]